MDCKNVRVCTATMSNPQNINVQNQQKEKNMKYFMGDAGIFYIIKYLEEIKWIFSNLNIFFWKYQQYSWKWSFPHLPYSLYFIFPLRNEILKKKCAALSLLLPHEFFGCSFNVQRKRETWIKNIVLINKNFLRLFFARFSKEKNGKSFEIREWIFLDPPKNIPHFKRGFGGQKGSKFPGNFELKVWLNFFECFEKFSEIFGEFSTNF